MSPAHKNNPQMRLKMLESLFVAQSQNRPFWYEKQLTTEDRATKRLVSIKKNQFADGQLLISNIERR